MKRRSFLRSAGVAGAGLAGLGSVGTTAAEHQGYWYHGTVPAPSIEEVVTQDGWAFCTSSGGLLTVDLSDPTMPAFGDRVQGDDVTSSHDIKVDTYTTAADEERRIGVLTHTRVGQFAGFDVFDVTDPANIQHLITKRTVGTVHNCFLKDGYAYLTISSGAPPRMVIYDLTDPANPTTMEGKDPSYESFSDVPGDEYGTGGSWMLSNARPKLNGASMHDIYVTEHEGGELAWLAYWDPGVVVVDVTDKRNPVAVAHFGAADDAFQSSGTVRFINGGGESNAHYVQPTPDGDYLLAGAETFGGTGHDEVGATGDFGGIRVFDTRDVAPLDGGGTAVYPEADGVQDLPDDRKAPLEGKDVLQRPTNRRNPDNFVDWVAYIDAPDQPDDALLTSHNFDVTETKVFTSWYQGGIRAFDLAPLYRSGNYEEHPESAGDIEAPEEIAAFAPDGMAFWAAVNLSSAQDGDTYFTIGSDIGKGAAILELTDGPFTPSPL
jgi:hypothetical protein